VRRTVATLLVVASPLLVAVPVGAAGGPPPGSATAVPATALPAAGVAAVPSALFPLAPPAVPVPAAATLPGVAAADGATGKAATPVRPVARTLRRAALRPGDLDDAAYAARLQAQLCLARTIFCGLDRHGRYPGH
jgi:hypothetical protein